jgi:hypothetical protein
MRLLRYLAIVLVATVFLALPAWAQTSTSGATSVTVNLPNIIILHYFSAVTVTITAADLTTYIGLTTPVDEGSATASGGFGNHDLNLSASIDAPTGNLTAAPLTLQNAWAVRALGTGNVAMTFARTSATLTNASGGTIAMTAASAVSPTSFAPPGLGNPRYGDVALVLDLTGARYSGNYAGGIYTVTATIP